jgi:hypothetical protein
LTATCFSSNRRDNELYFSSRRGRPQIRSAFASGSPSRRRARGVSRVSFREAAAIEERLAQRADAEGDTLRAVRSHFSAASAWANAGDFHHALTLLQILEQRGDAPEPLKARARAFAETLRAQRRQWHNTLQEASLS